MQNPDHTRSRCPKCGAGRGRPCVTNSGAIAERVHYGRPYWSSKVSVPRPAEPTRYVSARTNPDYIREVAAEVEARRYPN